MNRAIKAAIRPPSARPLNAVLIVALLVLAPTAVLLTADPAAANHNHPSLHGQATLTPDAISMGAGAVFVRQITVNNPSNQVPGGTTEGHYESVEFRVSSTAPQGVVFSAADSAASGWTVAADNTGGGTTNLNKLTFTGSTIATGASQAFTIGLAANGAVANGDTVTITVRVGQIGGNFNQVSLTVNFDLAAPTLTSAVALDDDANGAFDAMRLTFNEPVLDSSVNPAHFRINGVAPTGFATGATANDAIIKLTFPNLRVGNTPVPDVTYTPGTAKDLNGNSLAAIVADTVTETDGAGPVALAAIGAAGSKDVIVTFNEPVANALTASSFSYNRGAAGSGIASVTHSAGARVATVVLSTALVAANLGAHELGPVAGAALDGSDNAGPASHRIIDVPRATDLDGTIGSPVVTVSFNAPMDNGAGEGLTAGAFTLTPVGGGAAAAISSVSHQPGDLRASITLNEPISPIDAGVGGGPVLKVNLVADKAFVAGLPGRKAPAATLTLVDQTPPRITSLSTLGDGAGSLEAIEVKLSEFFLRQEPGVFSPALWNIAGYGQPDTVTATPPGQTPPAGNIDRLFLLFDGDSIGLDTADTPRVSYTGTAIKDLLRNTMADAANVLPADGAPPVPLILESRDANLDGRLDGVLMSFSEALDDDTLDSSEFAVEDDSGTWAAGRRTATGILSGTEDDETITVSFTQEGVSDTGVSPLVHYTPAATLKDAAGNAVDAFSMRATDDVAPMITQVLAAVGSTAVTVHFSEPVTDSGGNALGQTSLVYFNVNSGGATARTAVGHSITNNPSVALLTLNNPAVAGDIGKDSVAAVAGNVIGLSDGRPAATTAVPLAGVDGPTIAAAKTLDRDSNGYLDGIEITFDRAVRDSVAGSSTLRASDWTLPAPYGDVNNKPIGVVSSLGTAPADVDDAKIYLLFDEETLEKPDGDTAAKPSFSYEGGRIVDLGGKPLGVTSATEVTDGAVPRLMRVEGNPGSNQVELFFSEGVRGTGTGGQLVPANLQYINSNGVGAGSLDTITHVAGASVAQATLNRVLSATGEDHGLGITAADAVRARTTVIETAEAGGKAVIGGLDISITDTVVPQILSIVTRDVSGGAANGRIDVLEVTFTEPIQDGALATGQWMISPPYGDANGNPVAISTGTTANDARILLELAELQTGTDTEVTPTVGFVAAAGILDLTGNPLADFQGWTSADGAAPMARTVETRDMDRNGMIDAILVEFSESVRDSSFVAADWDVMDTTGTWTTASPALGVQVADDGAPNDAFILVTFAESDAFDTIVTPQVTHVAGGRLTDVAGNVLGAFQLSAADGAPAVIGALGGSVGSSTVEVRFSEGVRAFGGGALGVGSFSYVNGASGGATGINAVTHTEGDTVAIVTLDAVLTQEDFDDDEIGASPDAIQEHRGGTCSPAVDCLRTPDVDVPFVDLAAPKVAKAETLDIDANGRIDAVRVTFDEPIRDGAATANLVAADWKIIRAAGQVSVISVLSHHPNALPGVASDDDEVIYLTFAEAATGYDTASTPQVRYTPGSGGRIQDHDGHVFGGRTFATTDSAEPIVVGATSLDTDSNGLIDGYQVTASEAIEDDSFDHTLWTVAGTTVSSMGTGLAADDNMFRVVFTEMRTLGTGALPELSYAGGALTDLVDNDMHALVAGNAAAGGVTELDGAAPVIIEVLTSDDNGDGYLDSATVTFSEAIDDVAAGRATLDKNEWTVPAPLADSRGRPADVQTGAAAGDDKIKLTFVAPRAGDAFNTGLLPSVAYKATSTIADAANNKMLDKTIVATDGAKPVIASMGTVDRDDDGLIDGIKVTFSENVDDVTAGSPNLVVGDWTLEAPYGSANRQPTSVVTTLTSGGKDDADIFVLFAEVGTAGVHHDTGAMPWAELAAGSRVIDLAGNAVGGTLRHTSMDKVAPRLLTALTLDLDGNALIDGYQLVFSEAVDDTTFKAAEWAVEGTTVDDFLTGQAVSDSLITLTFVEAGALDTGAKPQLTYTPTATLTDLAGNGLRAITGAALEERDGVAPVFLRAVSKGLQSATVELEFSEPILSTGAGITMSDFAYTDVSGNGATGMTFVSPAADGRKVTVTLNAPFAQTDNGIDTMGVLAGKLNDAASNPVPATTRLVEADVVPPAQIFDLDVKASTLARRAVTLEWTTPSDLDSASFDLRRSSALITTANFASATQEANLPVANPGKVQELALTGLTPNTKYFFAIKTLDRVGNIASMSNVLEITTLADAVAPGTVTDLAVKANTVVGNGAIIEWTAPGDDAFEAAPADRYEIRYSTTEITAANFAQATAVASPPTPLAGGTTQTFSLTGLTTVTKYYVALRAADAVNNVGEISNVASFTTTADSTPPTSQPIITSTTHSNGVPSSTKVPVLSWGAVTDPDSTVTYHYKLSALATDTVTAIDASLTTTTITLPEQTDGTYYFHLAAISAGGSTFAAAYKIIVDTVAPGAVTLQAQPAADVTATGVTLRWAATGNDGNTGMATAYELRQSGSAITAANFASATPVTGLAAPKAVGEAEAFTVSGLTPKTTYHFALRALDGASNAGPVSASIQVTTKEDTTPPTGTLVISSSTHPSDAVSTVRTGTFTWTGTTDPETAVGYHYVVNTNKDYQVKATDTRIEVAELTIDSLANGRQYLHVRAASDGGLGSQATYEFAVLALSPEQLAKLRDNTQVVVESIEGGHRIKWTLPENLPAELLGVQVWFSNSPYKLLKTVPTSDAAFAAGSVVHLGAEAKDSTKYTVTLFFGESEALGKFATADDPTVFPDNLEGHTVVIDDAGIPFWGWILIGLGGLAVLALLIALVVVARKRDHEAVDADDPVAYRWGEDEWDQTEWEEPAQEAEPAHVHSGGQTVEAGHGMAMAMLPVHDVECPACAADFAVEGERPLTTTCPSCGVRGVLS